ncbi:helix-turn-helix domain-containing protein [Pectobacterium brasiliense]|uniref:helix-turn-helix domain-containing protein n=1 Tax=Pectobacterium brasiliense TaxID=180957 RepID=UPI00367291B3
MRSLSQQSFVNVTTREHLSRLERGVSSPNLTLVCEIARELDVHPMSLLALAFTREASLHQLFDTILSNLQPQAPVE